MLLLKKKNVLLFQPLELKETHTVLIKLWTKLNNNKYLFLKCTYSIKYNCLPGLYIFYRNV